MVTGLGRDVPGWTKGLTMEEWFWDPGGLFTRVGLLGNRLQEVVGAVARPGMAEVMPRTTWLPHFPAPGVERSTGSWRRASHVRVRVRDEIGATVAKHGHQHQQMSRTRQKKSQNITKNSH